jgi:hypothetical protein
VPDLSVSGVSGAGRIGIVGRGGKLACRSLPLVAETSAAMHKKMVNLNMLEIGRPHNAHSQV